MRRIRKLYPQTMAKMIELDAVSIGKRIKFAREHRRWSQRILADLCGVSQATAWRWENGEEIPPLPELVLVCMHLQRSLDFIVLGCARNGRAWRMARKLYEMGVVGRALAAHQAAQEIPSEPAPDAGRNVD